MPGSRSADLASTGDPLFVSEDGRTTFAVVWYPPSDTAFDPAGVALDQATAAADGLEVAGEPVRITGIDPLASGTGDESEGPSVLVETLIGGVGALIVLVFVFGSMMALVPLLMAAIAIPTTFLVLWPLAEVTEVSVVVQFLISLIGLGVAIDYSLLIVMRWREEVANGRDRFEAVQQAMDHAGRAVIFSGIAVAIGLLALVVLPVPFLRSIGYGGMLIPLISTLVAITLLPVILATIGPRLDRMGFKPPDRQLRPGLGAVGPARGAAALDRGRDRPRDPGRALRPGLRLLDRAPRAPRRSPRSGSARVALDQLTESGIGAAALSPYDVIVTGGDPDAAAQAAAAVDGVRGAVAPDGEAWRRAGHRGGQRLPRRGGQHVHRQRGPGRRSATSRPARCWWAGSCRATRTSTTRSTATSSGWS